MTLSSLSSSDSAVPEKSDRRIAITKRLLKDSLLDLMGQKPIYTVTVRDICSNADISRGTFYAHYTDQFHLLTEMEDEMFNEISSRVKNALSEAQTEEVLIELLGLLQQNATFFQVILASERGTKFLERVFYTCLSLYMDAPMEGTRRSEELSRFIIGGAAAVTLAWFLDGMKAPVEEVAHQLKQLSEAALRAYPQPRNNKE